MRNNEKPRILIVDDEKINLKVLADLLKDEYLPMLARNGEQALMLAFSDTPPDLILLDVVMPQMGGHEVIKILKNDDQTKNIPVIFVTALNSTEDEERGLLLGAVDYIAKPFSPPIVKMRLRNQLRIVHQYKLLDQLAYLDGLTEISNRRRFEEVFQKEWARSARNGTSFSLAMADVDYFKQYNDHYGHAMGDTALQKIARALDSVLRRPGDLIARYGGEEFVLLLPETDMYAAQEVAQRCLQKVNELNIVHQYSLVADHVSISLGIVTKGHDDIISPQDFVMTADRNLYLAKENGRNQIVASMIGDERLLFHSAQEDAPPSSQPSPK
ncbi:GGDEF domain-containing response regulator [Desulfopila aestuarii]|uniref:diguanylate cyclase n=1 Tax=Desulfopila aestuarii DSM 18488 TaxID=1121416 RepID=A0A1M7Y310_9BACT|nr:diguanylate cyclase [Desulfopila aestuarii]SHO46440.1 response regulator receiver modulated diguanylate cyclase [Desulfopila aestuarii DSM 18488]